MIVVIGLLAFAIVNFINTNDIDIDQIKPSDKSELIVVVSPIKDSYISSPLSISGRARGSWFFEGSFPILLTDTAGKVLAEGHATAQGEWTTDEFVKFIGTLQFTKPDYSDKGILILKKDNPSGLSEKDDSFSIPISFKK